MNGHTTFGRRAPSAPVVAATISADPNALSPEAEAFRKELRASRKSGQEDFAGWRRSQRGARLFRWGLSLALMAPGVLCFVFETPLPISIGLEVVGIFAGWWLRRARRRHLKEIASWQDPALEGRD